MKNCHGNKYYGLCSFIHLQYMYIYLLKFDFRCSLFIFKYKQNKQILYTSMYMCVLCFQISSQTILCQ